MYGVRTLHAIPTMLLRASSVLRNILVFSYSLCISTESDTLDQQPSRWDFTDERVRDSSDSALIDYGPSQHETASSVCSTVGSARGCETEEADDEEHDEETAETVKVESPEPRSISRVRMDSCGGTHLRPIPRLIRNQAPNTPIMLIPYWPSANEKLLSVDKPACWKK
jgi:hypothetical protein